MTRRDCGRAGAKHLSLNVTRSKFEQLTDPLLTRTKQPCKDCLRDAGLSQKDITEVLLVGGMTRMPKARPPLRPLLPTPQGPVLIQAARSQSIFSFRGRR